MILTNNAAWLVAESANILVSATEADLLDAESCGSAKEALREALLSIAEALDTIESVIPGGIPRGAEVKSELTVTAGKLLDRSAAPLRLV